jgi:hypothetical protein
MVGLVTPHSDARWPAADLVRQISHTTGLSAGDAERVVADVVAYFSDTAEQYVRRRHRELRLRGVKNEAIFEMVRAELARWPVMAPELSARQLRRIVYG